MATKPNPTTAVVPSPTIKRSADLIISLIESERNAAIQESRRQIAQVQSEFHEFTHNAAIVHGEYKRRIEEMEKEVLRSREQLDSATEEARCARVEAGKMELELKKMHDLLKNSNLAVAEKDDSGRSDVHPAENAVKLEQDASNEQHLLAGSITDDKVSEIKRLETELSTWRNMYQTVQKERDDIMLAKKQFELAIRREICPPEEFTTTSNTKRPLHSSDESGDWGSLKKPRVHNSSSPISGVNPFRRLRSRHSAISKDPGELIMPSKPLLAPRMLSNAVSRFGLKLNVASPVPDGQDTNAPPPYSS